MSDIAKGSIVSLKSGGPAMTVQEVGSYTGYGITNGAKCVWFENDKKKEDFFDVETLQVIEVSQ
jgi:uncharacterized protein YodC (DUF2158 family)